MQVVHHTDADMGSFDWELPPVIADKISRLPNEKRVALLKELEQHILGRLHILIGALMLGEWAETGLDMLSVREKETAQLMKEFVKILQAGDGA